MSQLLGSTCMLRCIPSHSELGWHGWGKRRSVKADGGTPIPPGFKEKFVCGKELGAVLLVV